MAIRTIARLYDTYEDGSYVVGRVEAAGVPQSDVSIVAHDSRPADDAAGGPATLSMGAAPGTGAGVVGTLVGGGAGLLAGIGALAIPGVGPVIAAGWLVATLAGAGLGAAAGGLLGSLAGAGIDSDEAHAYAEGLRRGGTLVTVRTDDAQAAAVERAMSERPSVDWQARAEEYRAAGWTGYDETMPAAPAAAAERSPPIT